jgi:hypothetical protein
MVAHAEAVTAANSPKAAAVNIAFVGPVSTLVGFREIQRHSARLLLDSCTSKSTNAFTTFSSRNITASDVPSRAMEKTKMADKKAILLPSENIERSGSEASSSTILM